MSFADLWGRGDYALLKKITEEQKPYRGTTNKYPLGNRKYSDRYFLWEGDEVHIHYYRKLGVLRSDNTFEFDVKTNAHGYAYLNQGENSFLSALFKSCVQTMSRKGGTVLKHNDKFHAVFNGLRFYTHNKTLHESCHYDVVLPKVNRAKAKELRQEYENMFKLGAVMLRASGMEVVSKDIKEHARQRVNEWPSIKGLPTELIDLNNPYDSLLKIAVHYNVNGCIYYMSHYNHFPRSHSFDGFIEGIKRKFLKQLYLEKKPFDYIVIKGGENYSSNEWDVGIVANGRSVHMIG